MTQLVTPVINRNGTDATILINQYREVNEKLCDVLEAMREAIPHGRDYPKMTIVPARDAMHERYQIISNMVDEFWALIMEIDQQQRDHAA